MLAGDFTTFASPACQGRQVTLGAGFVGNRIDPARFSPAALNLVKKLPATTDPCGQVTFSVPDDRNEGQYVGRADVQLGANHSMFGRYMATRDQKPAAFGKTGNVLTTVNPSIDNLAQSLTIGDTAVKGNNLVNALRFAFNRTAVHRDNDSFFDAPDLGIKAYQLRAASDVRDRDRRVQRRGDERGQGLRVEQLVPDQRRPHPGARQPSTRRGREHRVLQGGAAGLGAWRRPMELHRCRIWAGIGGSLCRAHERARTVRHVRGGLLPVVPGRVRARHLESGEPPHDQRGASVGTVLQPEPDAGCQHDLRPRPLQAECRQHCVPQRARRPHLPRRSGLSSRHVWLDQEVVELLAAPRWSVGRQRGRPHGGAFVVRLDVRLPDRRLLLQPGGRAAVRQPRSRQRSGRPVRRSLS